MPAMKTPGVYIVEKSAFPNAVVEVATAVPAFIGYTEKADNNGKSLKNVPWRIGSIAEFQNFFGGAPSRTFHVTEIAPPAAGAPPASAPVKAVTLNGKDYQVSASQNTNQQFLLYYSMLLFFQNGGGPCYIVSVGEYSGTIDEGDLLAGVDLLLEEQEPTMVAIPDAVHLASEPCCIKVQQGVLLHCGDKTQSRVAILDIYDGYNDRKNPAGDPVDATAAAVRTSGRVDR